MADDKDPFNRIPSLEDDEPAHVHARAHGEDHSEIDKTLEKGATPKKLLTKLQNWAVPVVAGLTFIWLLSPVSELKQRKIAPAKVEVNAAQQTSDSGALIKRLREDAEAKEKEKAELAAKAAQATSVTAASPGAPTVQPVVGTLPAPIHAGSQAPAAPFQNRAPQAGTASPLPYPMPTGGDDYAKYQADQQKRADEIRASPLEAGSFKLMADEESAAAAAKSKSKLSELQLETAAAAEQREELLRKQQAAQDRALAATMGQGAPRQRNSNEEFLNANSATTPRQLIRQNAAYGEPVIYEGALIRAVLTTDVTNEMQGKLKARVTSDVYDFNQRHVLIPKGSELLGVYNHEVAIGQESLLVAMTRLILPNGSWISLAGATGSNMIGRSGIQGQVNNQFWKMFSTSLILGGTSLVLPKSATTVTTVAGANGGTTPTAGSTFALALNDVLKTILERNKTITPTIALTHGQEFTFMVAQDMALQPYRP